MLRVSVREGGPELDFTIAAALSWLTDRAWPLWLDRGIDRKACAFHEYLDHDSVTCASDFRRLRVVTRQIFVFSRAAAAGVGNAETAVEIGLNFLRKWARLPDGGYAWRFGLDNRPIDSRRDLYDHAFVLLAFSAAAPIVGHDTVRRDARELLDYILANFGHGGGGYQESIPPSRPRRQNPHMHFFEACLAAFDAFGDSKFLETASGLADLCLNRLFQAAEGALPEFFGEDLRPIREHGLYRIEPGHHFEWIWLFDWYQSAMARAGQSATLRVQSVSETLADFADRFGSDNVTGLAFDGLLSDGSVNENGFRLWPQTERIKSAVRYRQNPDMQAATALNGFRRFLIGAPAGLWHERLDERGSPIAGPSPATSLYHITCALTDPAVRRLAIGV